MFGFLNVYKPKGITSHDVVSRLRRVTKIRQIGHTGTLDPFAEGVLPICIGKATRLIEYLDGEKEYLATVQFGANTETYDIEGKVTETFNRKVTIDEVVVALKDFEGEIFQIPPIYSAIKVNGKKLYDYARAGEEVEIQPRKVFISKIKLEEFDLERQTAEILVSCSKGTYIRSIAYDLGQKLNCGGHLIKLIRTQAGNFLVNEATSLDDLDTIEKVMKKLLNPLEMLNLSKLEITEEEHKKVLQGQYFYNNSVKSNDFLILIYNNNISAVAEVDNGKIKVKKVFG